MQCIKVVDNIVHYLCIHRNYRAPAPSIKILDATRPYSACSTPMLARIDKILQTVQLTLNHRPILFVMKP